MKHKLKFKCDDRNYKTWTLYSSDTLYELNIEDYHINPIQSKQKIKLSMVESAYCSDEESNSDTETAT